jgi:hypothetical protein
MIVLVTGGRKYGWIVMDTFTKVENQQETQYLYRILDQLKPVITKIVHGDAQGADSWAKLWAIRNNIEQKPYPANWDKYDLAAGPIRNTEMLYDSNPDIVLAFPGNAGTGNMIKQATAKKPQPRIIKCQFPNIPLDLNFIE